MMHSTRTQSCASLPKDNSTKHLLFQLAANGNVSALYHFIEEHSDQLPIDAVNSFGMNALHIAAWNGHLEVCIALINRHRISRVKEDELLESNTSTDDTSSHSRSILTCSSNSSNSSSSPTNTVPKCLSKTNSFDTIVGPLISNVNAFSQQMNNLTCTIQATALHFAISAGRTEIVQWLLSLSTIDVFLPCYSSAQRIINKANISALMTNNPKILYKRDALELAIGCGQKRMISIVEEYLLEHNRHYTEQRRILGRKIPQ